MDTETQPRQQTLQSKLENSTATDAHTCRHCGLDCPENVTPTKKGHWFCCSGCETVFDILNESGLESFYELSPSAPIRVPKSGNPEEFSYLDASDVRGQIVDFTDERFTRVRLSIPSIHCIACVWLLENLFRIHPGIGKSQVNFPARELSVTFSTAEVRLSELVALLKTLGYEPELRLADMEDKGTGPKRSLWLQLGVAGFAFGNIMLFSIPSYTGLDSFSGPAFEKAFRFLNLLLGCLVVTYCAKDYWAAAWRCVRDRVLTVDLPIAVGIAALFSQSAWEILSHTGDGYFDSLSGLVFFLLIGKWFQKKSYDRLCFDRDYKSFFPLSISRLDNDSQEERVALNQVKVGDRLLLRNGDLIPADGVLLSDSAQLDYSFVTGESAPVMRQAGEPVFAGGRHQGASIEIKTAKPVHQSYLTSLWNQHVFRQPENNTWESITNRYSRVFCQIVILVAIGTGIYWGVANPAIAVAAFTAVLIVACPCALALAAPFTLGTAQRILARNNVFLKNTSVIESLASIDSIVFDKTGTLTIPKEATLNYDGIALSREEQGWISGLANHSTHPLAQQVARGLVQPPVGKITQYVEKPGAGISGQLEGHEVHIGSTNWLASNGISISDTASTNESTTYVAIDGNYRGSFTVSSPVRPGIERLIEGLRQRFNLSLLSGDRPTQASEFKNLFGANAGLQFNQSPKDKLEFIQQSRTDGKVMMVGDGLNDAGALKQADVGVAVVEDLSSFSPASDVILPGERLPRLDDVLRFARQSVQVVRISLVISALYNVVGISIAAQGLLSPIICAILMPLSSVTVVAFACGATKACERTLRRQQPLSDESPVSSEGLTSEPPRLRPTLSPSVVPSKQS